MSQVTASNLSYSARLLFRLVSRRPGIHVREAQRQAGLGLGNTVYQLQKLDSLGLIDSTKNGKYKRYFPLDLSEHDRNIISALSIPSRRRILLYLLTNDQSSPAELASKLRLSKSTIKWHTRILQADGIITNVAEHTFKYRLNDSNAVTDLIRRFQPSTMDRLSEGFLESWDLIDL